MKPVCQITEIENGYLVMTAPKQPAIHSRNQQPEQQPQPVTTFCADYAAVCEALKAQFPPTLVG